MDARLRWAGVHKKKTLSGVHTCNKDARTPNTLTVVSDMDHRSDMRYNPNNSK